MNFIFAQMSKRKTLNNIIWKSLTNEGKVLTVLELTIRASQGKELTCKQLHFKT